jgi:putative ABC transport system substrate-binding protein
MSAKRVEFLKSIVPKLSHVALLTPLDGVRAIVSGTEVAARSLGLQVSTTLVRNPGDVDHAFSSMPGAHVGGVIVDLALRQHQKQILALALKSRLPTISGPREFVEAGGLVAYGPNFPDLFRRSAAYVDKILKGAKPADLPIEQPTKFELVINLKTAKALGLTIPQMLLQRADQVIE